jgi:acyl carrier protein
VTISSRTPEGEPHLCPVCGNVSAVEPSYPGGDSCCPACGHLLWWLRDRLSRDTGAAPDRITLTSSLADDLKADSLEMVELIMDLEEEFGVTLPDDAAERFDTVEDVIRNIRQHRADDSA